MRRRMRHTQPISALRLRVDQACRCQALVWDPSQNGLDLVLRQAHQATVFSVVMSTLVGPRPVPV